ncbi:AAA family ATPase [Candidatus Synechococcus calcipolaris G9]|uniref:AAA family ATPase n=1 Tax=Candidatus Synechococcus calcipolaris G9 TaxID=1497997 RepID=A0ABT6F2M6_9SYNE|nr:AAA family ATPase [Candidatus Synechococcus calcipolaris]MDG2992112.1 AAA family ATPase [Candidatus Synechococcus calcipolaris G9]
MAYFDDEQLDFEPGLYEAIFEGFSKPLELPKKQPELVTINREDYIREIKAYERKINQIRRDQESIPDCLAYRERLEVIAAIADPIDRSFATIELAKLLRVSPSLLERDLSKLESKNRATDTSEVITWAELYNREQEDLDWLVHGLLPVGETVILIAEPKCGKTLFAVDLTHAIIEGHDFLSHKTKQGKVLFISVDESLRSTEYKLRNRNFSPSENLGILSKFNLENLDSLEKELIDFQPDLVVLDSLRAAARGSTISENSAEFADKIYDLKMLFTNHKAAGIIIHHSTKSKEQEGVSKVRGNSAIAGAAWGVWQLQNDKSWDNSITSIKEFSYQLRDAESGNFSIKLNPDDFAWQKIEDHCDRADNNLLNQVIDFLTKEKPKAFEREEIANALQVNDRSLKFVLAKGLKTGQISKRKSETNLRKAVYFIGE